MHLIHVWTLAAAGCAGRSSGRDTAAVCASGAMVVGSYSFSRFRNFWSPHSFRTSAQSIASETPPPFSRASAVRSVSRVC